MTPTPIWEVQRPLKQIRVLYLYPRRSPFGFDLWSLISPNPPIQFHLIKYLHHPALLTALRDHRRLSLVIVGSHPPSRGVSLGLGVFPFPPSHHLALSLGLLILPPCFFGSPHIILDSPNHPSPSPLCLGSCLLPRSTSNISHRIIFYNLSEFTDIVPRHQFAVPSQNHYPGGSSSFQASRRQRHPSLAPLMGLPSRSPSLLLLR